MTQHLSKNSFLLSRQQTYNICFSSNIIYGMFKYAHIISLWQLVWNTSVSGKQCMRAHRVFQGLELVEEPVVSELLVQGLHRR